MTEQQTALKEYFNHPKVKKMTLQEIKNDFFLFALNSNDFCILKTARSLGVHPATVKGFCNDSEIENESIRKVREKHK